MQFDFERIRLVFENRHSVREFSGEPIDKTLLLDAIELANRCPSACNRQSTKVYVLDTELRKTLTPKGYDVYNADKYLIITGSKKAYDISEAYDWIANAGIFAGFLTLSLNAAGIGNCINRMVLFGDALYNKNLHSKCGIPDDEQIIFEMAIGNLKEEFNVPLSFRKKANDIVTFIEA